jgi:hypothetical protein
VTIISAQLSLSVTLAAADIETPVPVSTASRSRLRTAAKRSYKSSGAIPVSAAGPLNSERLNRRDQSVDILGISEISIFEIASMVKSL